MPYPSRIQEIDGKYYWRCSMCKTHKPESEFSMVTKYRRVFEKYEVPKSKCRMCETKYLMERRRKKKSEEAEDLFKA